MSNKSYAKKLTLKSKMKKIPRFNENWEKSVAIHLGLWEILQGGYSSPLGEKLRHPTAQMEYEHNGVRETKHKEPHTVWLHVFETSQAASPTETESGWV